MHMMVDGAGLRMGEVGVSEEVQVLDWLKD